MRNRILAALLVCFSLVAFNAKADSIAGVNLGQAGPDQWAVFTLGSNVSPNVDIEGQGFVQGNVGAAGGGNVTLGSGQAEIKGDLYYHTGGKLKNAGKITGHTHQNAATDTLLNQAALDAQTASDNAWALPVTPAYASLTNVNLSGGQNITITGSGQVVLKLSNFIISSGTFTLAGNAGTNYVINVSNQFSLSNSAKIILAAGISPTNVLFNIRGTGTQVTLSGSSTFNGVLLATKRSVALSGASQVNGEVIANSVNISGQARIIQAVTPSLNR